MEGDEERKMERVRALKRLVLGYGLKREMGVTAGAGG